MLRTTIVFEQRIFLELNPEHTPKQQISILLIIITKNHSFPKAEIYNVRIKVQQTISLLVQNM